MHLNKHILTKSSVTSLLLYNSWPSCLVGDQLLGYSMKVARWFLKIMYLLLPFENSANRLRHVGLFFSTIKVNDN